ncbi:SDR family NAD(P)-dependent oxidoreductase [Thermocrinis albus]|uniref:SDR family NAD(P)-dependent oxidoreductase n=1 Tax=Thermocrinis albus TaxID=136094 RepID=UPI0011D03B0C|nr:SDR family oxidoreductase [Thermocrinis albus]
MRAVVTGGSRGIGRAIVEAFLKENYRVCTCARHQEGLLVLKRELGDPINLFAMPCDVKDRDSVKSFVNHCVSFLGKVDVLVNNAGVLGVREKIEGYPEDVWEEVLRVNLNGMFFVTKYFIPYMERGGFIINMSSGVGKRPAPTWGAYAVSKFGTEGFSLLLAEELRERDIRVYAFNPGATRTTMRAQAYPQEDPTRLKSPEEVARAVLRLIKLRPSSVSLDYEDIL